MTVRTAITVISRKRLTRRALASGAAVLALLAPFAVAAVGHHLPRAGVALAPGQAWLADGGDLLALADGPSASFVTSAELGAPGLDLAQTNASAYAVDRSHRIVRAISGTTDAPTQFSVPGVDLARATALTSGGRLYLYPTRDGRIVRVDPAHPDRLEAGAPLPAHAVLAPTGQDPAVVDLDAATVTWYADGKRTGRAAVTGGVPGDPAVAGDENTGDVYLVDRVRGSITACRRSTHRCPAITGPAGLSGPLGDPVVSAGRLIVPEPAAGRVWVVRPQSVLPLPVFAPGTAFQLVEAQGYTFANPSSTADAAVIDPGNRVRPVVKHLVATTSSARPTTRPTPTPTPTPTPSSVLTTHPAAATARPTSAPPTSTHSPVPSTTRARHTPSTPAPTPTTTAPSTKPAPPLAPTKDVALTMSTVGGVYADTDIHVAPDADQQYFLMIKVDGDYYVHKTMVRTVGYRRYDLSNQFPKGIDLSLVRTEFVVSATGDNIRLLEDRANESASLRPPLSWPHGNRVSNYCPFQLPSDWPGDNLSPYTGSSDCV